MSAASKKPTGPKRSGETTACPWCSATAPVESATCPSCGASLRDAADGDILGVTQVDPAAVARTKRIRSVTIAAFLGVGDGGTDEDSGGKVEPPSDAVRQEMLRLRLAAIDAEIEAKAKEAAANAAVANAALPPDEPGRAGSGKAEPG